LVVIAVIGILVALLLPAVQAAREAARRMQCSNHLKQFGLAVHNYSAAFRVLPISMGWTAQGFNGKGWIVVLLPYLEQQALYDQFKPYLAGNMGAGSGIVDPGCRGALKTSFESIRCPSDATSGPTSTNMLQLTPLETAVTNYKGVAGTNLACRLTPDCDGLIWLSSFLHPISWKLIGDGTSHTLMVGEDVPDQNYHSGAYYANNDYCTTEQPLNLLFAPADPLNWPVVISFRSMHPGGVNFCLADGSVQFLPDSIDIKLYQAMSTRAGGEMVQLP
jgi:prepilin-type processing-associated H-X9-DG protein